MHIPIIVKIIFFEFIRSIFVTGIINIVNLNFVFIEMGQYVFVFRFVLVHIQKLLLVFHVLELREGYSETVDDEPVVVDLDVVSNRDFVGVYDDVVYLYFAPIQRLPVAVVQQVVFKSSRKMSRILLFTCRSCNNYFISILG